MTKLDGDKVEAGSTVADPWHEFLRGGKFKKCRDMRVSQNEEAPKWLVYLLLEIVNQLYDLGVPL